MTDITPYLSGILVDSHSSRPITTTRSLADKLDAFITEAYQINANISSLITYLQQIRQPYLSTAPPPRRTVTNSQPQIPDHLTDPQRESIDSSTSQLLRDLNANITNLTQAAALRSQTDTALLERKYGKPSGLLWRWAAGEGDSPDAGKPQEQIEDEGKAKTMKTFREGVLWYLGSQLTRAVSRQQEMVQIRIDREREKDRSVLYKMKAPRESMGLETVDKNGDGYGKMDMRGRSLNPALEAEEDAAIKAQLTPEQLQLFESENSSLLEHYNDALSKVTQAEKSLLEISSLQQTLVGHLTVQGEMIEQLVTDAANTDDNVRRGNKELKRAAERSSTAKGVFWVTVGLCGFLIGWDLVF